MWSSSSSRPKAVPPRGPHRGVIAALHPTYGFIKTDAAVGWLRPGKDVFFYGSQWESKRVSAVGMPVWFELELNKRLEGRRMCAVKGQVPSRGQTRSPRGHRGPGGRGNAGSVGQQVRYALRELLGE